MKDTKDILKLEHNNYFLLEDDPRLGKIILATSDNYFNSFLNYPFKLSLRNCQAIERGYDLDELAEKEFPLDYDIPLFETLGITEKSHKSILIGMLQGTLQKGFQKALEILGDKKFSEEDIKEAYLSGVDDAMDIKYDPNATIDDEKHLKSLQQTEWEVEIEMTTQNVNEVYKLAKDFNGHHFNFDKEGNKTFKDEYLHLYQEPKLDEQGCLILKRK